MVVKCMIKRYKLVVKQDDKSNRIAHLLREKLSSVLQYDDLNPDLIISVGGDGTMLYALHQNFNLIDQTYFLGIHTGTLGFYTDYLASEVDQLVEDIKTQVYISYKRNVLEVKVVNQDNQVQIFHALNEVRLENPHYAQILDIYIDDELLETFRGNGVCVSTSSGSTAYNKSLGGAVIHPNLEVMQLTEIAGIQHNAYRSLGSSMVLEKHQTITLKNKLSRPAFMGIDQMSFDLNKFKEIHITLSKQSIRCIQYRPLTFVNRIRRSFILE